MVLNAHRHRGTGQSDGKFASTTSFKNFINGGKDAWEKNFDPNRPSTPELPVINPYPNPQTTSATSGTWSSHSRPSSPRTPRPLSTRNWSTSTITTTPSPVPSFEAEPVHRQHSWREIKLRGAVKCFLKKLCSAKFAPLEDVAWKCKRCDKIVCFKCAKDREACI